MSKTKIEWADKVWNPVTGCTKVSAGCKHCYAERMSKRLRGRCGYPGLWDSINAKRGWGWDVNPWVWVVLFRRVKNT